MALLRSASLFAVATLFAAACGTAVTPTPTPTPTTAPTPTSAPSSAPASLDPSASDAGVVGQATVSGDGRDDRDGSYEIVGLAADGSSCAASFEGDEFLVSAQDESAQNGQIHQMFLSVPADAMPNADGPTTAPITNGRAGFDFVSDQFAGTLYVGEPTADARTTMSITVSQSAAGLLFTFAGTTWDGVAISGQMACAPAA